MSEIGKHKLTDALHPHEPSPEKNDGGKPLPTHESAADQARKGEENEEAREAESSIRERMIDIGRGNQQSGRQGQ